MKTPLQVYVDNDRLKALKLLAVHQDTTVSDIIRSLIDVFLMEENRK